MNWYYVENGQQAGPVDDAQLEALRSSGKIQPDTLIWSEGMANWQPYGQVKGGAAAASAVPPLAATAPPAGNEAVCAECGGTFNVQDTIAYGGVRVCARCKPVFMQKLAEGAKINTGVMTYAGFWTRFAAVFLDGLLLSIPNVAMNLIVLGSVTARQNSVAPVLQLVLTGVQIAIALTYETVMIGRFGATLGKMAMKIRVVTADGGKVSYLRALGRYFAKLLSYFICLIGFIMAGFDSQKRGLHDRICNTRVVMK